MWRPLWKRGWRNYCLSRQAIKPLSLKLLAMQHWAAGNAFGLF